MCVCVRCEKKTTRAVCRLYVSSTLLSRSTSMSDQQRRSSVDPLERNEKTTTTTATQQNKEQHEKTTRLCPQDKMSFPCESLRACRESSSCTPKAVGLFYVHTHTQKKTKSESILRRRLTPPKEKEKENVLQQGRKMKKNKACIVCCSFLRCTPRCIFLPFTHVCVHPLPPCLLRSPLTPRNFSSHP